MAICGSLDVMRQKKKKVYDNSFLEGFIYTLQAVDKRKNLHYTLSRKVIGLFASIELL